MLGRQAAMDQSGHAWARAASSRASRRSIKVLPKKDGNLGPVLDEAQAFTEERRKLAHLDQECTTGLVETEVRGVPRVRRRPTSTAPHTEDALAIPGASFVVLCWLGRTRTFSATRLLETLRYEMSLLLLTDAACRPTIAVSDKAKAMAYYSEVLGLTFVEENPVGATFRCGGTLSDPLADTAKNTMAGFEVTDLEAARRELRAHRVVFEEYDRPPTREGIARLGPNRGAWFKDPDGNILALVERGPTSRLHRPLTRRSECARS